MSAPQHYKGANLIRGVERGAYSEIYMLYFFLRGGGPKTSRIVLKFVNFWFLVKKKTKENLYLKILLFSQFFVVDAPMKKNNPKIQFYHLSEHFCFGLVKLHPSMRGLIPFAPIQ